MDEKGRICYGKFKKFKKSLKIFLKLRLAKAVVLPELSDGQQFPVRIIFVILGPSLSDGSYHELGRSLATLMANKMWELIKLIKNIKRKPRSSKAIKNK